MTRHKHTQRVESIEEYKEAVEAAETLGLEVEAVGASSFGWDTASGCAFHPTYDPEVLKVGRKYVHFATGDGKKVRAAFGYDSVDNEACWIRLGFK